ncbi:hypothetical protein D3C72_1617930 [compost metagenome]
MYIDVVGRLPGALANASAGTVPRESRLYCAVMSVVTLGGIVVADTTSGCGVAPPPAAADG